MSLNARIFVAGHRGMVGSAIVRALIAKGYTNLITRSHTELDLTDQSAVRNFFRNERIDEVYLAAAKVGGIHANHTYPADFIYQNLMIQTTVIHEAWQADVKKLLFLGSSCIYPRDCAQPIKEEYLLSSSLEPTNEPYAIAKIAGIKMCESYNRQFGTDFRSVMPCNLYGPGDNYDLNNCHVLPAMIRKFHLAKLAKENDIAAIIADERKHGEIPSDIKAMIGIHPDEGITTKSQIKNNTTITLWGTGTPCREFLHVDDLAEASIFIMELAKSIYKAATRPMLSHINVGTGEDASISIISNVVARIVGYDGPVEFDKNYPDGSMRKLMSSERISKLGWHPTIQLEEGIREVYDKYIKYDA